jgi:hypothetical protein
LKIQESSGVSGQQEADLRCPLRVYGCHQESDSTSTFVHGANSKAAPTAKEMVRKVPRGKRVAHEEQVILVEW